jgi:uncharacterized OsmC-like protein
VGAFAGRGYDATGDRNWRHAPSTTRAARLAAGREETGMVATRGGPEINGVDAAELREYIDSVKSDPARADREPSVIARWVGGTRAEVVSSLGGPPVYMGGDDDPSAMGMLLRALAACDVEVIVNRAALLGVEIEDLTIEARGYFNVARYLGVEASEGSGYRHASYTARLKVKGATPQQVAEIRSALEASPVGDTFERRIPVTFELDVT